MKTYRVECVWDATGWWVVTVPELPNAVTQVRRLEKVADDIGEVIELLTSKEPGTYELDVHWTVPGKGGELAEQARELRREAADLNERISTTTSTAAVSLSNSGFSYRDIGALLGVSHQRVEQVLKTTGKHRHRRGEGKERARS